TQANGAVAVGDRGARRRRHGLIEIAADRHTVLPRPHVQLPHHAHLQVLGRRDVTVPEVGSGIRRQVVVGKARADVDRERRIRHAVVERGSVRVAVEVDSVLLKQVRPHDHADVGQREKEFVVLVEGNLGGGDVAVHHPGVHDRRRIGPRDLAHRRGRREGHRRRVQIAIARIGDGDFDHRAETDRRRPGRLDLYASRGNRRAVRRPEGDGRRRGVTGSRGRGGKVGRVVEYDRRYAGGRGGGQLIARENRLPDRRPVARGRQIADRAVQTAGRQGGAGSQRVGLTRSVRNRLAVVVVGDAAGGIAVRLVELVRVVGPALAVLDLVKTAQRPEGEHEGLVAVGLGHVAVAAGDLLAFDSAAVADVRERDAIRQGQG